MKKTIKIITISILLIFGLTSCNTKSQTKYEAKFLLFFNTVTEVVAYAETEDEFKQFANYIYENIEEYHKLYDKYNTYGGINNIKTINDNAGMKPVTVDKKIIDLLLFSKEMYSLTNGKVNVAFGSVLDVWHEYRTDGIMNPETASLPGMKTLQESNKHTDINKVIIDEKESTVFLEDSKMRLDVGAIAKGYAAEQVKLKAIEQGYHNFILSLGGNTCAVGLKEKDKKKWSVGIQNPDKESELDSIYTLSITDLSLVASGNYERYYTVDGKQYHHIINPDTLMPSDYFVSVSILCEDAGLADTLSTAIYNMSYEKGLALIESLDNTEALWIFEDGTHKYSSNFQRYIKK